MAADGAAMQQTQQGYYPFRQNTRQKTNTVNTGTLTYSLGGVQTITLPKVGYVSKIYLRFNGTITYSSTHVPAKFAPYSIIRNLQVDLNSGKQVLVNCSGYEMFLLDSIRRKNARLDQQTDTDNYNYATTGTAVPLVFTLEVPIAISDGNNFLVGLINLQAPELEFNVTVSFMNALTDLGTNVSSLSGSIDVVYEYYEVPDPTKVMQPYIALHKIVSQTNVIQGTGENIFTIPRGGTLHRLIHVLELNGAKSDAWDKMEIWLNGSDKVYTVPRWLSKHRARQLYGYNLPTGTIVLDLFGAYGIPEESDSRDTLNSERVTTTQSYVTVTSGTTLGSNNNFLHTLREFVQLPS